MVKKDCVENKALGVYKPLLCRWCVERNCDDRKYSYDLAGGRRTMRTDVKTILVNGQYEWDWFGDRNDNP